MTFYRKQLKGFVMTEKETYDFTKIGFEINPHYNKMIKFMLGTINKQNFVVDKTTKMILQRSLELAIMDFYHYGCDRGWWEYDSFEDKDLKKGVG
jgi:hypothetical protein